MAKKTESHAACKAEIDRLRSELDALKELVTSSLVPPQTEHTVMVKCEFCDDGNRRSAEWQLWMARFDEARHKAGIAAALDVAGPHPECHEYEVCPQCRGTGKRLGPIGKMLSAYLHQELEAMVSERLERIDAPEHATAGDQKRLEFRCVDCEHEWTGTEVATSCPRCASTFLPSVRHHATSEG